MGIGNSAFDPALASAPSAQQPQEQQIRVVGWEANERGKPGPRVADLRLFALHIPTYNQTITNL